LLRAPRFPPTFSNFILPARRLHRCENSLSLPDLRTLEAYQYALPGDRIAKTPAEPREAARLLVAHLDGRTEDRTIADFPSLVRASDVLVVNETRVVRARLRATREPGGGAAEILLLRPAQGEHFDFGARRWYALVKPGRRLPLGAQLYLADGARASVAAVHPDGVREVELDVPVLLEQYLERHGAMPLPPYVGDGDEARAQRYQTVFARVAGSVAAPTASLHFSTELLASIRVRGVVIAPIVLDVGLGTFRPIVSPRLDDHQMHAEYYTISQETAEIVNAARREGRRIIAAGTTVVRALEASAQADGIVHAGRAQTALFITPGFSFRAVDALLTNFHLPGSTLLVLVSAFAGYERAMSAYAHAVQAGYRFYSFGDAMFVERRKPPAPSEPKSQDPVL
jgi:S-adenosylmethionine:tRNA ribosyltransferase-isomerase